MIKKIEEFKTLTLTLNKRVFGEEREKRNREAQQSKLSKERGKREWENGRGSDINKRTQILLLLFTYPIFTIINNF